ncbi:MAG: hypothetical protein JNN04_07570 [Cyclobacteriaceae bacterium]|nr:hypothetical protein [Cyclobacteriaceae bacterium]
MPRIFLFAAGLFVLAACNTQRMVCPAYQSSFIYDKEVVRQKFSYFKPDSTPKIYTASKNKYLVAVPESYRKKYRKMQTVEMNPVYPVIADSLKDQELYGLAEVDSLDMAAAAADSTYAITKTKEKYNLDQDLYMWYFREMLVLPDVRAAMEKKKEKSEAAPEGKKEKKGLKGFFQNLFKKKPKAAATDSATVSAPQTGVEAPPPVKKKGGLFKKKSEPTSPAKKEGDGF